MDGHGSHLTIEFMNYAWAYKISPFLLLAHSTHLLQLLDIGVFQSFKNYHQEVLEEAIRFGGVDYKREDFLASFQKMRDLTFKKPIICRAWEKAGLVLLDPEIVLKQMGEMSTPELVLVILLERLLDFSSCQTLRTLIAYEHYSSYIN